MRHFNWSPRIGDPTPGGWLTVILYLVAAYAAWRVVRYLRGAEADTRSEAIVWTIIAFLFLALGINKQLDLQSAFTELGRVLASAQGWYDRRGLMQAYFVGLVSGCALTTAIALLFLLRGAPAPALMALIGTGFVLTFVVVRAASFHYIDVLIGSRVLGLRWNWILEIGGILIVLVAARWRQRQLYLSNLKGRLRRRTSGSAFGKLSAAATRSSRQAFPSEEHIHDSAIRSEDPAPGGPRQSPRR